MAESSYFRDFRRDGRSVQKSKKMSRDKLSYYISLRGALAACLYHIMVSSDQKSLTELGESLIKSTFDGNYICMRELFDEGVTLDYKSKVKVS